MKITIISPYYPYPKRGRYYGTERYTENLALSLKELGNDVMVVTTYWNGGTRFEFHNDVKILRVFDTGMIYRGHGTLDIIHYITFGLSVLRRKNFKYYCDSDVLLLNIPVIFSRIFKIKKIPTISIFHHYL